VAVIVAEIAGAVLGGILLAAVGYFLPFLLLRGANLGMGLVSIQVFAAILGFGVGAGLGVSVAGRLLGHRGHTWLAIIAPFLTGGAVILVVRLLNINLGGLLGIPALALPLALAAAVVAYHLRRRA
jgi:hypothetical protein